MIFELENKPNRKIKIEEKEFLFFSGTAYLGLSENADFQVLIRQGLEIYGSAYGSSRNSNLQIDVYEKAEKKLANFVNAPAAITLSSGMLAGQVVVNQLFGHEFIYSPQTHPACWHTPTIDALKMPFNEWTERLIQNFPYSDKPKVIVCNANDGLRNEPMNFDWTLQLPDNQQITLLIDDSHSIGIVGDKGEGIYSKIKVKPSVRLVVTASLHKAMGIAGGVVFSDADFIQQIRECVYFSACSPITPALLWAYLNSGELYQNQLKKLRENINRFNSQIAGLELFKYQNNFPVYWTSHNELYQKLIEKNILIYQFTYPAKTGQANTRIVLSAWHEQSDIDELIDKIVSINQPIRSFTHSLIH
jgi:8-amino-7-oxononanoate synthase